MNLPNLPTDNLYKFMALSRFHNEFYLKQKYDTFNGYFILYRIYHNFSS